jgi:hypothetical protein
MAPATTGDARVAFLQGLIDDAGLFPPASLPMDRAAAQHRDSRSGPHRWMLGRFLCPAPRLPELLATLPAVADGPPWEVGVLLDPADEASWPEGVEPQLEVARRFEGGAAGMAAARLVEVRLPPGLAADAGATAGAIRDLTDAIEAAGLHGPVLPFVEVPGGPGGERTTRVAVEAIAALRAGWIGGAVFAPGAKIRCGGQTADLVPSPHRVAAFVTACRDHAVPFKATAGLHHPFRHVDARTGFVQHGFLNVVGAAVLAHAHGLDGSTLATVVADDRPEDFHLGPDEFRWQDLRAGADQIAAARRELFFAYGSCSFVEPVEDLTALGVLPVMPA